MKKIKIFVGVFLCMNLFTISGCDKVIHSAVVEEKDKTAAKKEENKERRTGRNCICVYDTEQYPGVIRTGKNSEPDQRLYGR